MTTALAHEGASGNVTILVTTPAEIQRMNREFRNIDRVTDVLTFPAWEGETLTTPPDGYLGDVAICLDRAKEQAEDYGHSLERELPLLLPWVQAFPSFPRRSLSWFDRFCMHQGPLSDA